MSSSLCNSLVWRQNGIEMLSLCTVLGLDPWDDHCGGVLMTNKGVPRIIFEYFRSGSCPASLGTCFMSLLEYVHKTNHRAKQSFIAVHIEKKGDCDIQTAGQSYTQYLTLTVPRTPATVPIILLDIVIDSSSVLGSVYT